MQTLKAKVIRGVYIRGTPYPEGAVGSVREDLAKQPGDAFACTHQEFHELRTANYLAQHIEPEKPAAAPAAPPPAEEPPKKAK